MGIPKGGLKAGSPTDVVRRWADGDWVAAAHYPMWAVTWASGMGLFVDGDGLLIAYRDHEGSARLMRPALAETFDVGNEDASHGISAHIRRPTTWSVLARPPLER